MPERSDISLKSLLNGALLLIAVPFITASLLAPFSIFIRRDALTAHYPVKKIFIEQVFRGEVPYWNPAASFGQPLLADPNMQPFYPDNVAYLLLPFNTAWNFHFLFHWIFGMAGIYVLLVQLGRQRQTALIGSLWWGGSGFILSLFAFYNLIAVTAWMPWVLIFEYLLLTKKKAVYGLLLGISIGLQYLAGEPVTSLCTWIVALLFLIDLKKRVDSRTALYFMLAILAASLAVLPQTVALLEIYSYTSRAMVKHSFFNSSNASLEIQRLMEWFVPYCWGPPYEKAPELFLGNRFTNFPFLIDSVHLSFVLLASFFLAIKAKRLFKLAAFTILFALALGRSAPFWKLLYQTVPFWDQIHFPIKFFAGALLFMILIAAEGFEEWRKQDPARFRKQRFVLAGSWLLLVTLYFLYAKPVDAFFLWQVLIAALLLALFFVLAHYKRAIVLFVMLELLVGARFLYSGIRIDNLHSPAYSATNSRTYFSLNIFPIHHNFSDIGQLYSAQTLAAFPTWGGPYGFRYAFDNSMDGLYSFYNDYFAGFLTSLPFPQQFALLSRLGVTQVVTNFEMNSQDWTKDGKQSYAVYSKKLQEALFLPASKVESKASPKRTLTALAALEETTFTRWITSQQKYAIPESFQYKAINDSSYGIEIKNSGKSFIVGRLTYFPTWRAVATLKSGNSRTLPVNQTDLTFIGVEAPPDTRRIILYYASHVTKKWILLWLLLMVPSTVILAVSVILELGACLNTIKPASTPNEAQLGGLVTRVAQPAQRSAAMESTAVRRFQ